ncbi:MAG: tryptophan-rich sensory protein [Dehalococcoidia bacterium]|nr:MAG: tryptophan-rich sensory protein [Dehalococcoidia bacterium]
MGKRGPQVLLSIFNIISFVGVVVVNALANALPINNKTTGALSDQYPNLFVPAGLTFSIWGLIYLLLAIFVVYSMVCALKTDGKYNFINSIGILFLLTCLANIGWIFAWHYQVLPLSMFIMLFLLACLIAIYLRLSIGKSSASNKEKYLVHLPFSIYLGWISIATIANVTALLVDAHWNTLGLGEEFWAVAVIIVGIAIALTAIFQRRDIFFGLVIDWALIGILIKRLSIDPTPYYSVVVTTIAGLILISLSTIFQIIKRRIY